MDSHEQQPSYRTDFGETIMAARLGNVLYWLGCGLAAIFALLIVMVVLNPSTSSYAIVVFNPGIYDDRFYMIVALAVMAVMAWLIGRACRYILADK
jgi:hypothetical protein